MKLDDTEAAVKDIQTTMTTMQASLTTLTQSVNASRLGGVAPKPDE